MEAQSISEKIDNWPRHFLIEKPMHFADSTGPGQTEPIAQISWSESGHVSRLGRLCSAAPKILGYQRRRLPPDHVFKRFQFFFFGGLGPCNWFLFFWNLSKELMHCTFRHFRFGLTFMLGSAVAAGLLFTLLVWVDSHVWIYLRKRKGYLQVKDFCSLRLPLHDQFDRSLVKQWKVLSNTKLELGNET